MGWNNDDWDGDGPAHAGDIVAGSANEDKPLEADLLSDDEESTVSPVDVVSIEGEDGSHDPEPPMSGVRGTMNAIWSGNGKYVAAVLVVIVVAVIVYKWRK